MAIGRPGDAVRRLLLLSALVLLVVTPGALAHAAYQSSDPPANGQATYGLERVTINFTEQIERSYTDADVYDLNGESVKAGPILFDEAHNNQIHVPVEPLKDGLYTVAWRALSVDSHTTEGTFLFGVGSVRVTVPRDPNEAHDHAGPEVARDGFARAVYYVGVFLAGGIPFFLLVIDTEARLPRPAFVTAALFGILGGAAALLNLLLLAERTSLPFATAAGTDAGLSFLWRGVFLSLSALCALAAVLAARHRRALAGAGVLLAAASMLATALGSHAAAERQLRVPSIPMDALHLAMGAIWVGGVVGFLHTVWGRTARATAQAVVRFTPWAMASVALLLATGTWATWRHVPSLTQLWTDAYGRLILLKIALLGVLVLIGAYNKEILGPRLARETASPAFFRRVVQVEALAMVCVLAAAGVLASTAPPAGDVDASGGARLFYEDSTVTKTTHLVLQISPNPPTVGVQKLAIVLHPLSAQGVPDGTLVAIKVAKSGEHEPEEAITLTRVNNETYGGEDAYFSSVGTWRVWVVLQRPDEYAKVTFDVNVQAPGASPSPT